LIEYINQGFFFDMEIKLDNIFERKGSVHLVGICGIGMAGLAYMLNKNGFTVSGCDETCNLLASWLKDSGIKVLEKHSPEHMISEISFVIRTPAVSDAEPELVEARRRGIPIFSRGEVLAKLLDSYSDSIAVSGTHGKTTTSSIIAQILLTIGESPAWIIGGENDALGTIAEEGSGKYLVAESDESDGTLALYKPRYGIITNIEFDHMDHFDSREEFVECFKSFINSTQGRLIYCKDDLTCCQLLDGLNNSVSYGFSKNSNYQISSVDMHADCSRFCIKCDNNNFQFSMPLLGTHNVLNVTAAIALLLEIGIQYDVLKSSVEKLSLPKRRFETVYNKDDIRVITDYSHHPTEIRAMIQTAKLLEHKKCRVVFQPHRYTRTKTLGREFTDAFEGVDELVLLPVYAASEKVLEGGTVFDLYRYFLDARKTNPAIPKPMLSPSIDVATDFYRTTLHSGDILLVAGAGNVHGIAMSIQSLGLKKKIFIPENMNNYLLANVPLGKKTTFGCGGNADFFAKVSNKEELEAVNDFASSHDLKFQVFGGGSNLLVSDLGFRGVACRLVGEFLKISHVGEFVTVGAGVTNASIIKYANENQFSGLEFLTGIPGVIGGAVMMNAGAFGSEIFDYIDSTKYYDGEFGAINKDELTAGYRTAPEILKNKIVTSVILKLNKANENSIALQKEYSQKRRWQQQYRTAGSTFKNPEKNVYAGELIQNTLVDISVGGAFVAKEHFNFICADKTATSSDILALINHIQFVVNKKYHITLDNEIILL
jgi:UDP-N-acetylmuramate--L-alanine ligase/UDP-N-acetylenolpyruvoylglucosamine reductase